jgi:hypothetical protein
MKLSTKKISIFFIISGFILFSLSGTISALSKKFIITTEKANIHLEPCDSSPVIDVLDKDTVLMSASPRKFKKVWNYVYFQTEDSKKTKSGYINDNAIKKINTTTKIITIQTKK